MNTAADHGDGYVVRGEHPSAETVVERCAAITTAVARAAELIRAGYNVRVLSPSSAASEN